MLTKIFRRRDIASAVALLIIGAGLVAALDRLTGNRVSLASLYMALAVYGAWRWERIGAAVASLAAVAAAVASDFVAIEPVRAHAAWSTEVLRLFVYLLVSFTVASLRASIRERDRALEELRTAMAEIRTLRGLLPMCAWCKHIRDDEHGGTWISIERYIAQRTPAEFTHGICPACAAKLSSESDGGTKT